MIKISFLTAQEVWIIQIYIWAIEQKTVDFTTHTLV